VPIHQVGTTSSRLKALLKGLLKIHSIASLAVRSVYGAGAEQQCKKVVNTSCNSPLRK